MISASLAHIDRLTLKVRGMRKRLVYSSAVLRLCRLPDRLKANKKLDDVQIWIGSKLETYRIFASVVNITVAILTLHIGQGNTQLIWIVDILLYAWLLQWVILGFEYEAAWSCTRCRRWWLAEIQIDSGFSIYECLWFSRLINFLRIRCYLFLSVSHRLHTLLSLAYA